MKLLDINVLLASHRDDHPQYDVAQRWIDRTVSERKPFAVVDLVAGAFLRIATTRRVFATPTPIDAAFAYVRALREEPSHVMLAPGPRHLDLLESLCAGADASGDLVADAQLAAIAVEHACELVSFDRDFARFSDVVWALPS